MTDVKPHSPCALQRRADKRAALGRTSGTGPHERHERHWAKRAALANTCGWTTDSMPGVMQRTADAQNASDTSATADADGDAPIANSGKRE